MNCLITGGSRGIGLAIAKQVAGLGFGVTLVARNADLLATEARALPQKRDGQLHDFWALDMGNLGAVESLSGLKRPLNEYSAFINCAGVAGMGLLATQPVSSVQKTLNVNLLAPIVLSKLVVRAMLRSKSGDKQQLGTAIPRKHLIFLSSLLGSRGAPGSAVYSATKAGLEGFTRSLAREVGSRNIAVNCVAPGLVDTDMAVSANPQLMANNVFPGLIEPSAVVDAVTYLLKSRSVTGQTLAVDSGASA